MIYSGDSKRSGEKAATLAAKREVRRGAGFLDLINCIVEFDI